MQLNYTPILIKVETIFSRKDRLAFLDIHKRFLCTGPIIVCFCALEMNTKKKFTLIVWTEFLLIFTKN